MVIKEKWNVKFEKLILEQGVNALFLNHMFNWSCDNYNFLKNIPQLLIIDIIDSNSKGISSVGNLIELKIISLNMYITERINFNLFLALEYCDIPFSKNVDTIFELKALKSLIIGDLKIKDNHRLENLENLEELIIGNSNISNINFLNKMGDNLKILELLDCRKIVDFSPINNLKKLVRLRIDGYKDLQSIDFIKSIITLEQLILNVGKISNIKVLETLPNLKVFALAGAQTFIEDGDLYPLANNSNLSVLFLVDKKHYSHKTLKHGNWDTLGNPQQLLIKK